MSLIKDKKFRNDIFLAFAVLIIAGGFWLWSELSKEEGIYVAIIVNGEETERFSLSESREIRLENNDGYNILVIENGKADVIEASCPDKICVNQHSISRTGETITCLPNKTVIKVVGNGEDEIDFVS